MKNELIFGKDLLDRFVLQVKEKYPQKAFGYFVSSEEGGQPDDFIMFKDDVRDDWKTTFEEYGDYYVRNKDAGFLATDKEMYEVYKELERRRKYIVGVYHSHQRHPAIFSTVDIDLHPSEELWHLIISLRNVDMPQIKAFAVKENLPVELSIRTLECVHE